MRVRLNSPMDDGKLVLPIGTIVDLDDSEARYLLSVQAVELAGVDEVEEAKPATRRRKAAADDAAA